MSIALSKADILRHHELRKRAMDDRENVGADQDPEVIAARVMLQVQRALNAAIAGEQNAEYASLKRLREYDTQQREAEEKIRSLVITALEARER